MRAERSRSKIVSAFFRGFSLLVSHLGIVLLLPMYDDLLIEGDDVLVVGVGLRETEGQIVRLAARVHQETDGKWFRKERGQAARADYQIVVEEAVVGGKQGHLFLAGAHHRWMTVTHVGDIIDAIQVAIPSLVVHVLSFSSHDLQRIRLVEQFACLPDMTLSKPDRL